MALPVVGARAEVANMAMFRRDMGEVNRSVTGFTGKMAGAFASATRGITSFGTQMVIWGTRIKRVGTSLTFYVTLPLLALGVAAGKAAIDFESGMAGVAKTTDLTIGELELLRKKILDLSMDQDSYVSGLPKAAEKMAKFGEVAGSMGIEGVEAILAFAETASLLEVTTDIIGEDVVRSMAQFIKITGVADDEIDNLGSTLVILGNNMPTTESQILHISTRIAPIARLMGLNAEQTLAWGAAIASTGIRAQKGGSALSRVMMEVQDAVSDTGDEIVDNSAKIEKLRGNIETWEMDERDAIATLEDKKRLLAEGTSRTTNYGLAIQKAGTALFKKTKKLVDARAELANLEAMHGQVITDGKLERIAKLAGMTGDAFKKAWKEDASLAFQMFVKGLRDVHESGGDVFATLEDLNIEGIRDVQTVSTLAATYDNLDEALRLAEEGWTGVSRVQRAVMEVYPELTKNLQGHNYLMEEAAKRDKTTAAQLAKLGNTLRGVAIVLGDTFLPIVNDVIASAIPLVKRITELDQKWIKWGIGIGIAAAALGPFLAILGTAISLFGLMLSPIGLVATAIGGLAWLWTDSWDDIFDAADDAWYYMNTYVFMPLHDTIEYLKVTLLPGLKKDWKDTWDAIVDKASGAWTWLNENIFGPIKAVITAIYTTVLATWQEKWGGTWDTIRNAATTAWESLRDNVFAPLKKVIETITGEEIGLGGLSKDFESVGSAAAGAGQRVAEGTLKIVDFRDKVKSMIQSAAEDFISLGGNIDQAGGKFTTLRDRAREMIRDAAKEFFSFGNTARQSGEGVDTLGERLEILRETTARVTESILKAIENLAQQAGEALDEFAKGFAKGFDFTTWQANLDRLISTINTQLLPAIENIAGAISGLFGPTEEAGEAWFDFGTIVGEEVAKIPSYIEVMVTTASELLNGFAASMRGEWSEAAAHFAEAIFGPEEGEKVAEGAQQAIYWIEEFSRVLGEKAPTTVELLNAIQKGLMSTFAPDILVGVQNAGVELGLLGEFFPSLEEKLTSWDKAFAVWIEGMPGTITEFWTPTWEAMKKTVDDVITALGGIDDAFIKAFEGIKTWWAENFASTIQPVIDFPGKVLTEFEKLWNKVMGQSIIPDLVKGIFRKFWWMYLAVKAFITGSSNSIVSMFKDATDDIVSAIDDIDARFAEFVDSASSGLENMIDLADGFAQALNDIPTDLETRINLAFSATLDRISRAFVDIENLNFDQTITITGRGGREVYGSYAAGGVVPGAIGAAQMAVVHGGEIIIPPGTLASYQGGTGFMDVIIEVVRKFSTDMGGLFAALGRSLVLSTSDITDAMGNAERVIDDTRQAQERLRTEHESISEQIISLSSDLAKMEEAGEQSTERYKKTTATLEKQQAALKVNEAAFNESTKTLNETMAVMRQLPGTMLEVQAVMEKAAKTQSAFTDAQKKFTKLNEDIATKRKQLAIDEFEIGTKQLDLQEAMLEATKAKPGDELRAQIRVRRAQASLEKEMLAVEKATAEIKSMETELASTNHEINILGKTIDQLTYAGGVVGVRGPFYDLVIAALTEAVAGRRYASGGIVPGRRGQPYLGVVHGGERILPVSVNVGGGGGGGTVHRTTNNYNNVYNANYGQTQQYGSLRRDLYRWSMLNQGVA